MSERIVRSLGDLVNRRRFLRKAGAAAVGGAMLLLGIPSVAAAVQCKCCTFPYYCSTNACPSCPCRYTWYCTHTDGTYWQCNDCGCPFNCWYYKPGPAFAAAG